MMWYRIGLLYWLFSSVLWAQLPSDPIASKALKSALLSINHSYPYTFFCDTPFSADGKISIKICEQCQKTTERIQWMRIVPTAHYAARLSCYKDKRCVDKQGKWFKGIECCKQQSTMFRLMHHDLFNFVPEAPQLSRLRRRYSFRPLDPTYSTHLCAFHVEPKQKSIYVAPNKLGRIARTYLYMDDTYEIGLSTEDRQQYKQWHHRYPPTQWEKQRNQKIKTIQGNDNHWITALPH